MMGNFEGNPDNFDGKKTWFMVSGSDFPLNKSIDIWVCLKIVYP